MSDGNSGSGTSGGSGGGAKPGLPIAEELESYLDGFVMGQTLAKRSLATAVYNHYLDVRRHEVAGLRYKGSHPQHVLLLGPTGSGKSYMVRKLAKRLSVPFVTVSASTYARTGYVGGQVDTILQQLYGAAGNDIRAAQRGIVFIDEIDKIRRNSTSSGPDVSGEGVQVELLDLLGGRVVEFKTGVNASEQLDVSRILFVAAGAFGDLPEIVRRRLEESTPRCFGFACKGTEVELDKASDAEMISQYTMQDLVDFGLIPELVGRFSTVVALDELSEEQLEEILVKSPESALRQQIALFKQHGIDLEFTDAALRAVARNARRMKTGARSLQRAVLRALDAVDWLPADLNDAGVVRIVFDAENVETGSLPQLLRAADGKSVKALTLAEFEALKAAPARPTNDGAARLRQGAIAHEAMQPIVRKIDTRRRPTEDYSATEPMVDRNEGLVPISEEFAAMRLDAAYASIRVGSLSPSDRAVWERIVDSLTAKKMLRLCRELQMLKSTAEEFLRAAKLNQTDSIRAVLHFVALEKKRGTV
jgi:ATP-dependent Clp protease ATP-binding subunit ClpX